MAFRASQPRGSSERIRRLSVGSGCFGVRSSTQLPSASFGWAGQRRRRVAHVGLVQRRRVHPELLAVRDDLLRRRLGVLPAELATLLEIDGALGRDGLVEALVEG